MTINEIAEREESALELLPPTQTPSSMARQMLAEHANMYNDAWKLAGALVKTTMVPRRFLNKQGDATAAILYGAELGLNPIQSLQRVIPIHGMPSLEARTMVGLLKHHGYGFRVRQQSDEMVEIWAWEPGSPKVFGTDPENELDYQKRIHPDAESKWTIDRAKKAGYVPTPVPGSKMRPDEKEDWVTTSKTWDGKTTLSIVGNMKYITDPQTMLKAKGQAEVSRELAPDVLMGISYTREELESEDQRQFDRMDDRGAAPARVTTSRVTEDQIFAEEVPLSAENPGAVTDNPVPAAEQVAEQVAPETPAGDVTEDQGEATAPDPEPSPAEQPETVPEPAPEPEPTPAEAETKAKAKKVAAKRSTAPAADPDRPKSRMRQALEKRLFTLLGDAGINGEADRDGRIAVYRAVLERPEIGSTDDLDDPAVGKVADQLYAWQQQNELDDQIAGILSDAARGENDETAAPAADSTTSEGTEQ